MLGIARNTYRSFRNGEKDYSLTIKLAMAAIAGNLEPWGS
jgi:DNA-binding XRE family transcriptional regulator